MFSEASLRRPKMKFNKKEREREREREGQITKQLNNCLQLSSLECLNAIAEKKRETERKREREREGERKIEREGDKESNMTLSHLEAPKPL